MEQLVGPPELAEQKVLRALRQRIQGVQPGRERQHLRPNQSLVAVRKLCEVSEIVRAVRGVALEVEPAADLRMPPIAQPASRVESRGFGVTRPSLPPASAREGALRTLEGRSEEHTSELQSRRDLVCRL